MNQLPREPQLPHLDGTPASREKPNGMADPAGEAGWFLQRERESRGLSLQQAGDHVGIHPYHIEAIELGDMTHMPSRAEALEMIAAYADFLGFEPEPLLHHYLSFLPAPEVAPRRHPAHPAPLSSAKILQFGKFVKLPAINFRLPTMPGGNNGIVASVVGAFVAFSALAWTMMPSSQTAPTSDPVAQATDADPMPTASTGQDDADIKITDAPMEDQQLATVDDAQPATEDASPGLDPDVMGAFIQENVAGAGDVTPIAEPPQVASAEGRVFGSPEGDVRITLKAMRPIWLLIEDDKGNRVATQPMNKGDVYRVPNRPGLVATVQDGGALRYLIDGVEKGVLGKPGAVLAAEPLDVDKLQSKG